MIGKQITADELMKKIEKLGANSILIDVRTEGEFKTGAIPGSVNIPLNDMPNRVQELVKKDAIYVVCQSGSRSQLALLQLEMSGAKNVVNLSGGISSWIKSGFKLQK